MLLRLSDHVSMDVVLKNSHVKKINVIPTDGNRQVTENLLADFIEI